MLKIIHFGEDSCHRLMVLEGVGYSVERCESIENIEYYLRSPDPPDAIIISDEFGKASRVVAYLANVDLPIPLILFASTHEPDADSNFDLVIPALTSPSNWLSRIEEMIARFRDQRSDLSGRGHTQHVSHAGRL